MTNIKKERLTDDGFITRNIVGSSVPRVLTI
jgi:hypothetical protein